MSRSASRATLAGLVLVLAGCAPDYSPNTYGTNAVQQANKVEQGTVIGVRQVEVVSQGATGAVAGGAAGGIIGSQTGTGGVGSAFGALGGTLIGGLVGSAVERTSSDTKAFEYIVRKGNAELVSVTQKDEKPLALGQQVLVIAGNQARIVPDYTVQFDPHGAKGIDAQGTKDANDKAAAADKPAEAPTVPVVVPPPAVQSEPLPAKPADPIPPISTPPTAPP